MGPSLVVQWLKLSASNARGLGLIPGQGTRSHMQQLRVCLSQLKNLRLQQQILKILSVAIKTRHSQINKYIYTFFFENYETKYSNTYTQIFTEYYSQYPRSGNNPNI